MLAGVVSNTEGRADAMKAAVDVLRECGAELIIHCGDVGGRHVLDAMTGVEVDTAFVWGDTDKDRMGLLRHAQRVGVICLGVLGDFEIDGKRVALLHGDDRKLMQKILDEQQHDYLFWGHGAEGEERTVGKTKVIHPGSLYGAGTKTFVLIDAEGGAVRRLAL